ncbi:MAG: hypothetical protein ABIN41_00060 [Devosia sp.]
MQFKTATALAALLTAVSLTPALALSLNLSGSGSASASSSSSVGDGSASAGASLGLNVGLGLEAGGDDSAIVASTVSAGGDAELSGWGNIGLVVNLIESSDWTATSFDSMSDLSAALFTVDDGANSDARATLDAVLGVYATDVAELQAALSANVELSGWLAARDIALDSVIAANLTAEGTLALYTD